VERAARGFEAALDTRNLKRYAAVTLLAMSAVGCYAFFSGSHGPGQRAMLAPTLPAIIGWLSLVVASLLAVTRAHDRLFLIVMTSVIGLIVSLAFLHLSAPDLALTQISIEIVTVILMLLALNLMPKTGPSEIALSGRFMNGLLATGLGAGVAALAYAVMTRDYESISAFHIAQAKPGGGGTNVVNVILVDFRALDTLGEIMVLGIAGVAIFALLASALSGRSGLRLERIRPKQAPGDPHSLILTVGTRVLLPLVLTVGIFIFLRGHNEPGGGFIAGILVGIAFIMQYIASGYRWSSERARIEPSLLIGSGILIAALSGIGSWPFGYPYLTSTYSYVTLPIVGTFEIASVIVFDLGVFLTVFGIVMISLANLARVEEPAASIESPPEKPPRSSPVADKPSDPRKGTTTSRRKAEEVNS